MGSQSSFIQMSTLLGTMRPNQTLSVIVTFIVFSLLATAIFVQTLDSGTRQAGAANHLPGGTTFLGKIVSGPSGPNASLSFLTEGNRGNIVPPIEMSYFYHGGLLYPFGSAQIAELKSGVALNQLEVSSAAYCGETMTFPPSQGWTIGSASQPSLIAQDASVDNYVVSQGTPIPGPASTSVVLGGVQSWPSGGAGLLMPPMLNYLFAISANGSGIVDARVVAYNWVHGTGFVPFAQSDTFVMSTLSYQNLTVQSSGWGQFSISVNSTVILTAQNGIYVPNVGSIGLWVGQGWTMNYEAVFVNTGSTIYSTLPANSCHTVTIAAFSPATNGAVSIFAAKQTTLQVLGVTETLNKVPSSVHIVETAMGNMTNLSLSAGMTYLIIAAGGGEDPMTFRILNAGLSTLNPGLYLGIDIKIIDATLAQG